jgi:hypothetical protein
MNSIHKMMIGAGASMLTAGGLLAIMYNDNKKQGSINEVVLQQDAQDYDGLAPIVPVFDGKNIFYEPYTITSRDYSGNW